MIYKTNILIFSIFIIIFTGACTKINKYFGLKDDNDVEQMVEKVIEDETGLEVDLTPEKDINKEEK